MNLEWLRRKAHMIRLLYDHSGEFVFARLWSLLSEEKRWRQREHGDAQRSHDQPCQEVFCAVLQNHISFGGATAALEV